MTLTGLSKKRPHSEIDGEACVPIAKKLNGLHIGVHPLVDFHDQSNDRSNGDVPPPPSQLSMSAKYEPSLSYSENPIYYEANRLLYEVHLLRLHREARRKEHPL